MNVEIMTAEELVRYAKPTTTLEKCLIEKLRETLEFLDIHEKGLEAIEAELHRSKDNP